MTSITPFLELLNEPVATFDLDGVCTYANPALARLLGREPAEVISTTSPPDWIDRQHVGLWSFIFNWCRSHRGTAREMLSIDLHLLGGGAGKTLVNVTWDRLVESDGSPICVLGLLRVPSENLSAGAPQGEAVHLHEVVADLRQLVAQLAPSRHPVRRIEMNVTDPQTHNPCGEENSDRDRLADLSEREREVLAHLLEGQRIATIAQHLFLSEHTVRNHLKAIYRKLGLHSLAELRERLTPTGTSGR